MKSIFFLLRCRISKRVAIFSVYRCRLEVELLAVQRAPADPVRLRHRRALMREPPPREAITRFAEAERCEVVDTFTEVETGKGADALDRRPQLAAALKGARKLKCPSSSRSSTG